MDNTLRQDFRRLLDHGAYATPPGRAVCAFESARTLQAWRVAESQGLVRLVAEPEQDNYFDVYGEPDSERERAQILDSIERCGLWFVKAEYFDGNQWEHADSIGMCIYSDPCSPFENCYVPDLMRSALDHLDRTRGETARQARALHHVCDLAQSFVDHWTETEADFPEASERREIAAAQASIDQVLATLKEKH